MTFTTLYCIIGRVLAIVDVIIVKHYVDNINRKYTVTMATAPPTVNMADTLHVLTIDNIDSVTGYGVYIIYVLTYISREAESKELFDDLASDILC